MAVVINDFEVVAEPPPASASGQGGGDKAGKESEKPTAEEVLHWLHERHERVRAH
jgi:hypothetical protein